MAAILGVFMLDSVLTTISYYIRYYGNFLAKQWRDMTPMGYGMLLVSIGVFGYFLMKSGMKKPGQ